MSVFSAPDFDDHEQVVYCRDRKAGLQAIIAIHDTRLGPALGGCRMRPYPSEEAALGDCLRLARGMTCKAAVAGLALGGGKSVILGDPRRDKSPALLRAMGRCVERLAGRYIVAEDAGTSVEDLRLMAEETGHVVGIADKPTGDGGRRSGDPSPATAHGVFLGIRAAVGHRLGRNDLAGVRVAIQGVGHVGLRLARLLAEAGARLWLAEVDRDRLAAALAELPGAEPADPEAVFDLDCDVFSPCAFGAVINDDTVPRLRAAVVAGAANNQLAAPRHGELLAARGILYAPDFVINAGGLIDVACEREGFDRERLLARLERIADNLLECFQRAEAERLPTSVIAERMAAERLAAVH